MFVREMSREKCQAVVAAGDLARLACCRGGQPYIVPISTRIRVKHFVSFPCLARKLSGCAATQRCRCRFPNLPAIDGGVGRNEKLTPPIASPWDVTEALCTEMAVIFSCRGVRR